MNATSTFHQIPHVKIYDDSAVGIDTDGKKYLISLDNIRKIYIKKRKTTYFPSFMGMIMFHYEKRYRLHIRTEDEQEIKIPVKAEERQHFIDMISFVRKLKSKKEATLAS